MKLQLSFLLVTILFNMISHLQEVKAQVGNTRYGTNALYDNTTGDFNTAIGTYALLRNTTGSNNVALGNSTMSNNKSGNYNVAAGNGALRNNSTGSYNSAFGDNALTYNEGSQNTAIGFEALKYNTTGNYNTASGTYTLYFNTTGTLNTASGYRALFSNKTGTYNTASGYRALYSNDNGSYNTAYGVDALKDNSTGYNNTATGYGALHKNTIGFNNTAIGNYSLRSNTTGSRNTALGDSAGAAFNSTYSTFLGYKTDVTAIGLTNVTVLGHRASATASNQVRIGNNSVTSIGGKVSWSTLSDGRFKKNISEEVPGLEFINQLRAVIYTLDIASLDKATGAEEQMPAEEVEAKTEASREKHTGFIAQEVEETAKKLNYDFSGVDKPKNSGDFYGLRYAEFVVPLVKAVQELDVRDKKLEEENRLKDKRITKLEEELANLRQMVMELAKGTGSNNSNVFKAYLEGSTPNPASGAVLIRYYVPQNRGTVNLVFTDIKGAIIRSISVNNRGTGQLTVNTAAWTTGTYTYTLYVNGIQADSKKLVIAR